MDQHSDNNTSYFPVRVRGHLEMDASVHSLDVFSENEFMRRPPDWRGERVLDLIAEDAVPSRADDRLVSRSYRFYNRYQALLPLINQQGEVVVEVKRRLKRLGRDYPFVGAAYQIHAAGSAERYIIEALVCAEASVELIADEMSCKPELVDTYEKLFFDARTRLNARGWLAAHVMRPSIRRGFHNLVYQDLVWKAFAHAMGAEAFFEFLGTGQLGRERRADWYELVKSQLARDAIVTSYCRTLSPFNGDQVIEQYMDMQAQEVEGMGAQLSGKTAAGVDTLVQAIAFSVASLKGPTTIAIEERPYQSLNRLAGRGFFAKETLTANATT